MLDFPSQRFGHYYLLDPIARGPDTVLYRAQEGQSVQLVALKIFERPSSHAARRLSRFYRELEIVHQLDHSGILPLNNVGEAERHPYLSMPLCEGTGLSPLLRRPTLPGMKEALELTIGLARTLGIAHQRNLLHRNLKPSNILFHEGQYKITDFGVAQLRDLPSQEAPVPFAAHLYQAPEQIMGLEVDRRADIFVLAVLLYQMLAGAHPFESTYPHPGALETLEPPSPPSRYNDNIPPLLDRALVQSLSRDPGKRPPDCATFAATLERILRLIPSPTPASRTEAFRTPTGERPHRAASATNLSSNIVTPLFPTPAKPSERKKLELDTPPPSNQPETWPRQPAYPWATSKNKRPPWIDVLASAHPDPEEESPEQAPRANVWRIAGVVGSPDESTGQLGSRVGKSAGSPDEPTGQLGSRVGKSAGSPDEPTGQERERAGWSSGSPEPNEAFSPERDNLQAWPWVPGAIGPSIQEPVVQRFFPKRTPSASPPVHVATPSPWSGEFPPHTSYSSPTQDPELVALLNANRGANVPLPPAYPPEPATRTSQKWIVVFGIFIAVVVSFVYFYDFEFVSRDLMLPAADSSTSLSRPQEGSNTHTRGEARKSDPENANAPTRDSTLFTPEPRDTRPTWPAGQDVGDPSAPGHGAPSNPAGATYHLDSRPEDSTSGY